jgi:putative endonuclease
VTQARRLLGRRGEAVARRHLRRHGLSIIGRNWVAPGGGEIDVLARDGDTLVVVEVRTASHGRRLATPPELTVGADKQRRLKRLARQWLAASRWRPGSVRFDVIGVVRRGWLRWDVRWIQGAFED